MTDETLTPEDETTTETTRTTDTTDSAETGDPDSTGTEGRLSRDAYPGSRDGSIRAKRPLVPDGGEEENSDETGLVHLDLEGLFLDVLGLEVTLDEVVLDISAVSGPGNLLGNLLSAVGGLLDTSLGGLLDGVLPEGGISEAIPDIPSGSDIVYGGINVVLDAVLSALGVDTENDENTESDEDDEDTESDDGEDSEEEESNEETDGSDAEGSDSDEDEDTEDSSEAE